MNCAFGSNNPELLTVELATVLAIPYKLLNKSEFISPNGTFALPQAQPPPHQPNQAHHTGISYLFVSGFRWYTFSLLQLPTLIVLAASPLPHILVCAALLMIACKSSGNVLMKSSLIVPSAFLANVAYSWIFLALHISIPLADTALTRLFTASM